MESTQRRCSGEQTPCGNNGPHMTEQSSRELQHSPANGDVARNCKPNASSSREVFERIASALEQIVQRLDPVPRIADKLDPPVGDKVGTPYVAKHMGLTTVWVAEMARKGDIPTSCIVPGTGTGKPWKFHRDQIDEWIESR